METPRVLDAHVHHWDVRNTPRDVTLFVKLFGWNRPLMHGLALRLFPKNLKDFFGEPDNLLQDYLPSHHLADTGDWSVDGFVHVEAAWRSKGPMGPVDETRWLESLGTPRLRAIVGHADLRLGDEVDAVLRVHLAASDRFRGVRHNTAHHPRSRIHSWCDADGLTNDPTWRQGYARLEHHGLSFDANVYGNQLDDIVSLARDFPGVPLILDHAGIPIAYGGPFGGVGLTAKEQRALAQRWRASMGRLAELPNVSVKISGLGMPLLGFGYHQRQAPNAAHVAENLQPIVDFLIGRFGAERCMFASNFPVDRVSMPWTTLYEAYAMTVSGRSDEERQALFYGTAARVYRIEA